MSQTPRSIDPAFLKEMKRVFHNPGGGLSYISVVEKLATEIDPAHIFEWGPGYSTIVFATLFPRAKITGVEHDPGWHKKCQRLCLGLPNATIHHEPITLQHGACGSYVTLPLYLDTLFDLIMVDGRHRCDCTALASRVLSPAGIVLVHDADRQKYWRAFDFYKFKTIKNNTAVLSMQPHPAL